MKNVLIPEVPGAQRKGNGDQGPKTKALPSFMSKGSTEERPAKRTAAKRGEEPRRGQPGKPRAKGVSRRRTRGSGQMLWTSEGKIAPKWPVTEQCGQPAAPVWNGWGRASLRLGKSM